MAKKKGKKKASRRKAAAKFIDLDSLLEEVTDAQTELRRIRKQLVKLRPLCRRLRVVKG